MLLVVVAAWGAIGFGAPAPVAAQATCVDYLYDINLYLACAGGPTITVFQVTPPPGGPITVDLQSWLPGSSVQITIDCGGGPVPVGTVDVLADAHGAAAVVVPANCPPGPAIVSASGPDMLGVTVTRDAPIVVTPISTPTYTCPVVIPVAGAGALADPTTSDPLYCPPLPTAVTVPPPYTGSESTRLGALGAALVLIGASALYGSWRVRDAIGVDDAPRRRRASAP